VTDAEELVLVESAFGRTSYDDGMWWYVAVIDNPNADYVYDPADIDIEALDAEGALLDSDWAYETVLSGSTALVGVFTDVGSDEIASLDVRMPAASEAAVTTANGSGAFVFDEEIEGSSDDYLTTVTGRVGSDFAEDLSFVWVRIVARDEDGTILGGGETYVELLPADGTMVEFEAVLDDVYPDGTVFEAYATF
jgi:hypothetical protein